MDCPKCDTKCFQQAICMQCWWECPHCNWTDLKKTEIVVEGTAKELGELPIID